MAGTGVQLSEAGDPLRTYSADEQARLTRNLLSLEEAVERGEFSNRRVDCRLIEELHSGLFAGVRDHGGKMRARGWGQEHLAFGPIRSAHRNDVNKEMTRLCESGEAAARLLCDAKAAPYFEGDAIAFAVRWHADMIRIHPFEDGNGRTGRLMMGVLLVRLGLRVVPVSAPKQEYFDVMNHYHLSRDPRRLVDLFIRLYPI